MNSFGKILVVFVTASSLGFAAFTLSLVAGGPNWEGDAESEELTNDFVFTVTAGDRPSYSVKTRRTDQPVGSATPVLAEAVVAARKKQIDDLKAEETTLNNNIARVKPMIDEMRSFIPPDRGGMTTRALFFDKILKQLSTDIQTVTDDIAKKAAAIQQLQKTAQERRDEAYRLKNQLELLRTDLSVLKEQQKILEDELVRVQENQLRLERREKQLKQQVVPYDK